MTIYICLIALAVTCVAAGWQLRGNYDDRKSPRLPIDDVPPPRLPVARLLDRGESQRLEIPTVLRKRQAMPRIIDVTESSRG